MFEAIQEALQPHVGWILLGLVFLFLALRVPIGVALALPAVVITLIDTGKASSLAIAAVGAMNAKFLLTAIPFFILSSAFLSTGGAAERIVRFAVSAVGHLRGGMANAGVFSCMLFAALSGSSPATVAAIGPIAIRGMRSANYPLPFAAGVISTAGTLGILIPPSIVMVVYAAATNESVGRMFMAGIVPGLLAGLILIMGIWFAVGARKIVSRDWAGWGRMVRDGYHAFFGLLLILIILVGIYTGEFTPTEAAAVAAVYGFITATLIYRGIGFLRDEPWRREGETVEAAIGRNLWKSVVFLVPNFFHAQTRQVLLDAAKMAIMLMFVIFNALIFSHALTEQRLPQELLAIVQDAELAAWSFLILINILLLVGGQFMEPSGLLLIVAPIAHPIAIALGIDPIHLGIIMVVNMEIGMITPPVGLNLFVTSSITGMDILSVMKAALPWTGLLFLFLILITFVPEISLTLPDWLYGVPSSRAG